MGADSGDMSRLSVPAQWVLEMLLEDPSREWSGMQVARANGLSGATVYPLLARLEAVGWLQSRWEAVPPGPAAAPARRLYRLGGVNAGAVRQALAAAGRPATRTTWGLSGGEA
jgi:DNA-binding IclR family transcriptional regulator